RSEQGFAGDERCFEHFKGAELAVNPLVEIPVITISEAGERRFSRSVEMGLEQQTDHGVGRPREDLRVARVQRRRVGVRSMGGCTVGVPDFDNSVDDGIDASQELLGTTAKRRVSVTVIMNAKMQELGCLRDQLRRFPSLIEGLAPVDQNRFASCLDQCAAKGNGYTWLVGHRFFKRLDLLADYEGLGVTVHQLPAGCQA